MGQDLAASFKRLDSCIRAIPDDIWSNNIDSDIERLQAEEARVHSALLEAVKESQDKCKRTERIYDILTDALVHVKNLQPQNNANFSA